MWTAERGRRGLAVALVMLALISINAVAFAATPPTAEQRLELMARELKLLHTRPPLRPLVRLVPQRLRTSDARLGHSGAPILAHIWSVYCPPCIAEMAELSSMVNHLKLETGIRVIFIAEDPPSEVLERLRDKPLQLPDVEHYVLGQSGALRSELQDTTQPLTLLLDGTGMVRQAFLGPIARRRNEIFAAVSRFVRNQPGHAH